MRLLPIRTAALLAAGVLGHPETSPSLRTRTLRTKGRSPVPEPLDLEEVGIEIPPHPSLRSNAYVIDTQLSDAELEKHGCEIMEPLIDPETANPDLLHFLSHGSVAISCWVERTLCSLRPDVALKLLRAVEPGALVLTEDELEDACRLGRGDMEAGISWWLKQPGVTQPIHSALLNTDD